VKIVNKQFLLFRLVINLATANGVHANSLPDEINHPHYYHIYKVEKSKSDAKRLIADEYLEQVQNTETRISQNNNDIQNFKSNISQTELNISNLNNDNQTAEYYH
jgi:peptidoglycan hydrolase CwlO-like protein